MPEYILLSMVLYFDIDSTLFDTPRFAHQLLRPQLLDCLQVAEEELRQREQTYKDTLTKTTDFLFPDYCRALASGSIEKEQQLLELYSNRELYQQCLYPEVIEVLTQLQQQKRVLGIYSEGFTEFQLKKLDCTDITVFFSPSHMHIARRKLDAAVVSQLKPGSIVIDDNLEYIEGLQNTPVHPVWINRVDDEVHSWARTIHTLTEVLALAQEHMF